MDLSSFCQGIKRVLEQHDLFAHPEVNQYLLSELMPLCSDYKIDTLLGMTNASIFFEGFYRHLGTNHSKNVLTLIRAKRWSNHFGVPTVTFLLTYKNQIAKTKQFFDEFISSQKLMLDAPWRTHKENDFVIDHENYVLVDSKSITQVVMPQCKEVTGTFTKTHNPCGGYTTTPSDPVSQQFIEHAAATAFRGGKVLEIGAAFGAATLEAIAKGATVFCNDIDPDNLAVVRNRFLEIMGGQEESVTGDSSKLILIPGMLPDELPGLPDQFFDAILICRVLHFFTGEKIEESLSLMSKLLAPGGKIYIVCETPFLKNWERFLPEFNKRVEYGAEWPGEITNPAEYENSGRAASLPTFVHWITKEVLERSLCRSGFTVTHSAYINRAGQFPEDLLLPEYGKESVGAIGTV